MAATTDTKTPAGLRKHILKRWAALQNERSSWLPQWRKVSEQVLPRNGRFLASDRNKGDNRFNKIYDSTATRALRILSAGMMSGMTSPARPWFKLAIANPQLNESYAVKVWLQQATDLMHQVFNQSNFYRALQQVYEELGAFGTAAVVVQPDFKTVIHCHTLTVGEYAVAVDGKDKVNTLYREFELSVGQLVDTFGYDACSQKVQNLYDRGEWDKYFTVIHAIEPRRERDGKKADSANMPFRSVYLEKSGSADKVLRESGYRRFPALCPRWNVTGGDVYGTGPAMEALGDINQLQLEQKRKAQAIDYMVNPPLVLPQVLEGRDNDMLPGGVIYGDAQNTAIRSLWEVRLDLNHLQHDIAEVKQRINSVFFADVFMMISSADTTMTATEVAERHEEKMLMLGPVLERLQNELLEPAIEIAFDYLMEAQVLPPPPDELQGMNIEVRLVSILAQAQQAIGMNSLDRFIGTIGQLAGVDGSVLDNVNFDRYVQVAATSYGIDPTLINPPEQVQAVREQRQQQMAQQQQMAVANQAADTMQKMAQAQQGLGGAGDVMGRLTGYT